MSEEKKEETRPTPEEMKAYAMKERPDDFIDIKTLVLAVRREENDKLSQFIGNGVPVPILKLAIFDLTRTVSHVLDAIEIKAMQEAESKIVKPGFINRVTKGAFGKGGN